MLVCVCIRTRTILYDGPTGEEVPVEPVDGELLLTRIKNPRPTGREDWFVIQGTKIGATESGWKRLVRRIVSTAQEVKDANDDGDSYLRVA